MARKLTIVIAGDDTGARKAFRNVEKESGRLGKSFDVIGKKSGGLGARLAGIGKASGIAAVSIGAGAVALGKSFYDAAIESQKVTKQTEAVIKSMGGASKVSAKEVADLSEKLSLQSGVDDELIQSGQNVLLTFGHVRNEVGKGNDIFTRATQNALDMSVALGTDLKGANIQVGKALNDPIKGVTALTRAGVSFTADQKAMIKELVTTGDTLGAQKIILSELDKQFGGSAKAQATAGDRLKVAWGNLQEQLGEKLIPIVEKVAAWLAKALPKAMKMGEQAFKRIQPVIKNVIETVRRNWPQIQKTIASVMSTVSAVIKGAVTVITVLWNNFGNNILSFVKRVWPAISMVINAALKIIRGIILTVTSLIKGDWGKVWEGIKQIVNGVWKAIQGIIRAALEVLRGVIGIGLEIIGSIFKRAWQLVKDAASAAWRGIVNAIKGAWGGMTDWVSDRVDGIVRVIRGIPGRLAKVGAGMFNFIKESFKGAINWVIRGWNALEFKIPGFDPPGPGPKFGGFTLGLPDIPQLASGGIVTRATLALVGESGPEAVVPLGSSGFGTNLTIDLRGAVVASNVELERVIVKAIQGAVGRNNGIAGTNIVRTA